MASTQENIEAFDQQIEKSLDLRIDELKILDEEKAETLIVLKDIILELIIKGEKEGDGEDSGDLFISGEEFEFILMKF